MSKQPQNLEPVLPIEPQPPQSPEGGSLPLLTQPKHKQDIKIPTYRALPHTRRGVVCDFFREKVFNLPKEPMPFYQFDVTENGFDFEFLGAIDNPSPLCDRSEAEAAAQKYIKTQNEAWAQYWGFSPSDGQQAAGRSEPFLPLFDDFLELQDCYAVYHPNFEGHVLYWQVNYRVMLPSVRIGKKQYRAAVQGEYVRIGIYNDRAARMMQFRHFAVEEVGREPYFFAPKTVVTNTVVPVENDNVLAKSGESSAQTEVVTTTDVVDEFGHDALLYRLNGDCYTPFAATPQGEVAGSKSGVTREEDGNLEYLMDDIYLLLPKYDGNAPILTCEEIKSIITERGVYALATNHIRKVSYSCFENDVKDCCIEISIRHGSSEEKTGGLLGGHAQWDLGEGFLYGFTSQPIAKFLTSDTRSPANPVLDNYNKVSIGGEHLFESIVPEKRISYFQVWPINGRNKNTQNILTYTPWYDTMKKTHRLVTNFIIPVSKAQFNTIKNTYHSTTIIEREIKQQYGKKIAVLDYAKIPPYDYAVFGHRCQSSLYEVGVLAGIFPNDIFLPFTVENLIRKLLALGYEYYHPHRAIKNNTKYNWSGIEPFESQK